MDSKHSIASARTPAAAASGAAAAATATGSGGGSDSKPAKPVSRVYTLRGVQVKFPFDAYEPQLIYMERVIECLQEKDSKGGYQNALLESPTGTGKTLCLLCATLAWQEKEKAEAGARLISATDGNAMTTTTGSYPRIIYSSRTHSQLSQVIGELRNTAYQPRMAVLGSRQQMCVHPTISQQIGAHQNNSCRTATQHHSCTWNENNAQVKQFNSRFDLHDIEELTAVGREKHFCPYFLSRDMAADADIVFVPYNYLIDPHIRATLSNSLKLEGSIVIFDEAHNLEGVCGESASFDLTSTILGRCVDEIRQCVTITHDRTGSDAGLSATVLAGAGASTHAFGEFEDEMAKLKGVFHNLEEEIARLPLTRDSDGGVNASFKGDFMFALLAKVNIKWDTKDLVIDLIEKATKVLFEDTTSGDALTNRKSCALSSFQTCIRALFRQSAASDVSRYYRVYVAEERESDRKSGGGRGRGNTRAANGRVNSAFAGGSSAAAAAASPLTGGRTVSYWCFSPGVAMRQLCESQRVRNVLLTSGTLSPMDSFAYELQLPFTIKLENPHVIKSEQVWIGVIDRGPAGAKLNSNYQNRNDTKVVDDLGNAIVNFARTVPDGLLVFFPSYSALHGSVDHWQRTMPGATASVWERISKLKHPVVEPRSGGANEFARAMDEFDAKLRDPAFKGAVFFAVMRGKVSEGLDFSDGAGRAVVITGLPYPMLKDPKVKLKREYLDSRETKLLAAKSNIKAISGSEWYSQQAARAINQAIGRVIRHIGDYGAILLCDERFLQPSQKQQLSLWLRNKVQTFNNFGAVNSSLNKFFKNARDSGWDRPLKPKKEHAAAAGGASASAASTKRNRITIGIDDEFDPTETVAPSSTPRITSFKINTSYEEMVNAMNGIPNSGRVPSSFTSAAASSSSSAAAAAAGRVLSAAEMAAAAEAKLAANDAYSLFSKPKPKPPPAASLKSVLAAASRSLSAASTANAASAAAAVNRVLSSSSTAAATATAATVAAVNTQMSEFAAATKRKRDASPPPNAGPVFTTPALSYNGGAALRTARIIANITGQPHDRNDPAAAAAGDENAEPTAAAPRQRTISSVFKPVSTPGASASSASSSSSSSSSASGGGGASVSVSVPGAATAAAAAAAGVSKLTGADITNFIAMVRALFTPPEYQTFKDCIHDLEAVKVALREYNKALKATGTGAARSAADAAKRKADASQLAVLTRLVILFVGAGREHLKFLFVGFIPTIYQEKYRETLRFTINDELQFHAAGGKQMLVAAADRARAAKAATPAAAAASTPPVATPGPPAPAAAPAIMSLRERMAKRNADILAGEQKKGGLFPTATAAAAAAASDAAATPSTATATIAAADVPVPAADASADAAAVATAMRDKKLFLDKVRALLPKTEYGAFKEMIRRMIDLQKVMSARSTEADPVIETLRQIFSSNVKYISLKRDFEAFVPHIFLVRYRAIMYGEAAQTADAATPAKRHKS